jgi:hypothetical protein
MSALRKRLYYIWKKLSEIKSRKKFRTVYYKNDIERFEKCTNKKPPARIKQEMKALQTYWGCYPFQYYRFDFYRADCPHTVADMRSYMPFFFFQSLYFPLSYKEYGVLCEDKLISQALLKAYGVPQPKMLFCFDHDTFYDSENNPISAAEADALIQASGANKLFVKPRFGIGGKGIAIFNKSDNNQFYDEQHKPLDHHFFQLQTSHAPANGQEKSNYYVVQEGLVQHEELHRIYPHAVNTFRIITECNGNEPRILYCVVRMGTGGRQIDNASAGGIFVRINLETGVLYEKAQAFDQSTCTRHPDSGYVFNGVKMEIWSEVKSFTLSVARKFREIKHIGWDIAFTPEGPSVIEFNNKPDMAGIQDSYGGILQDFNVNPKDWWYQSNYTLKSL